MDLAELKQLESKIDTLEKEKQELIDRQHQVVVYHKYFNGKLKPSNKHGAPYIRIEGVDSRREWNNGRYFKEELDLTSALNGGFVEIDLTEDSSRHTKDYINMSEAVAQIRAEVFEELSQEIKSSKERAASAELTLETLSEDHKSTIERLRKFYDKETLRVEEDNAEKLDKVIKEKDTEIKALKLELAKVSEDFESFKTNKKQVSLEEELVSLEEELVLLKEQLNAYKSRSFLKRIFNK